MREAGGGDRGGGGEGAAGQAARRRAECEELALRALLRRGLWDDAHALLEAALEGGSLRRAPPRGEAATRGLASMATGGPARPPAPPPAPTPTPPRHGQ